MTSTTTSGFQFESLAYANGAETFAVKVSGIEIGRVTRRKQTIRNTTHTVWYANSDGAQYTSRKDAVHAILYPEGE